MPTAINSSGQVVGYFQDLAGVHAFLYQAGSFTTINCANVQSTKALSISDAGIIYGTCGSNIFQYVISTAQLTTTPIQYPAGASPALAIYSNVAAISPAGEVFVGFLDSDPGGAFEYSYPTGAITFLNWLPGGETYFTHITGANASGEVVGNSTVGFQYLNGVYSPVTQLSTVYGVGPSGQILGVINGDIEANQMGAVVQDGVVMVIQVPSTLGYAPTPYGINASGSVVGTYYTGGGLAQGFLATPAVAPATEKSMINIETPSAGSGALFGSYVVSGWAIDNTSGTAAIDILVDGSVIGTVTPEFARPDVCAAYPGQIGCPTVGWQYKLDTTQLADGSHTLEARAISNTGQKTIKTVAFTVKNAGVTTSPLKLNIEAPTAQSPVSGQYTFSGWAIDPGSYVYELTIALDASPSTNSYYNQYYAFPTVNRPDVCTAYPGDLDCPRVGWYYTIDTTHLTNGPHAVTVYGYAENGDAAAVTQTFTVANSGPLKLVVDQPTATSGTLSGNALISGWAMDANAPVDNVTAVIDGLTQLNAFYGGYRADVCTAIPNGVGCPNVGWSALLDTTQLANGKHTLSVSAYAESFNYNTDQFIYDVANSQPISITVNNPVTATTTTHVAIDVPTGSGQQFWGQATFSGWALDDATLISRIDFIVDGTVVGSGNYFYIARPDVCVIFPNRPGCPNVGWSYSINTFGLSNGTHTFTVRAVSETNAQATASATFTVQNEVGLNGTHLTIDVPAAGAAALSGQASASGWALSQYNYVSAVNVTIDGGAATPATFFSRPDVCAVYPDAPSCPNVGWYYGFDTTVLANGVHRLNVTAVPQNNGSGSLPSATQSVFFTVANSYASSPILDYIDVPNASTATLSGVQSFSGWALDQNTSIADVSVAVDGVPFGTAAYGGLRPDVCAAYPQYAGCPAGAVGWFFAMDTTLLANGSHTLAVTAASSDGLYHTVSATFTTAN